MKISSSQYSFFFGNGQIHFPYSIASLISYVKTIPVIRDRCNFQPVFLTRDDVERDACQSFDSDILLCSCYSWNWEITTILARRTKELNPGCVVIFGGPEVPDNAKGFFGQHPYVDIIVHGEGELTLAELLGRIVERKPFDDVAGSEVRGRCNPARPRIEDLDIIPSPYSTGLMLDLVDTSKGHKYIATWETNRGCCFACAFCDWGSATKSRIRNFSQEKLFAEAEWFGQSQIVYVDCADGNFGIYADRDYEIADRLCAVKERTGFPTGLNLTWVKTSSERIMSIAKRLSSAGLLRAVSLSVQSFDKETLGIIKRSNIKFDVFENLVKKFSDEGIQSYTELIMGLPGETVTSFKKGWETLASIYPQPTIMTWNCSVFVNAPMNDRAYRTKHGIMTFRSPAFLAHSVPLVDGIVEHEEMVNATATCSQEELESIYVYNWMMLVFHSFGILEMVARYFNKRNSMTYIEFYDHLLDYCLSCIVDDNIFSKELLVARAHASRGYSGGGWGHVDPKLGEIAWPLEEASWLRLISDNEALKKSISKFVTYMKHHVAGCDATELDDLIEFQMFVLSSPADRGDAEASFKYDWLQFFIGGELVGMTYIKSPAVIEADLMQWGYKTMWFGRRSQRTKIRLRDLRSV